MYIYGYENWIKASGNLIPLIIVNIYLLDYLLCASFPFCRQSRRFQLSPYRDNLAEFIECRLRAHSCGCVQAPSQKMQDWDKPFSHWTLLPCPAALHPPSLPLLSTRGPTFTKINFNENRECDVFAKQIWWPELSLLRCIGQRSQSFH